MKAIQKGFTLIELMIAVAIMGILAAVALPAYKVYTIRAKMSEVILAASACRTAITEVYQSASSNPEPNGWGCEVTSGPVSKYVNTVTTDTNGAITVTVRGISSYVDGSVVTLVPLKDSTSAVMTSADMGSGIYSWRCGNSTTDLTTVAAKYLPGSCRGK